jgi:hypothetical protein
VLVHGLLVAFFFSRMGEGSDGGGGKVCAIERSRDLRDNGGKRSVGYMFIRVY